MVSDGAAAVGWRRVMLYGLLLAAAGPAQASERLDVSTFSPPLGWARQSGKDFVGFSHQATPATFCVLALYTSRAGAREPDAEFQADWQELVLHNGAYTGEPPKVDRRSVNGWTAVIGVAAVRQPNGQPQRSLLADFVAGGRVVSVVAQFNGDRYLDDVRTFVGGLTLDPVATPSATPEAQAAPAALGGGAAWTGAPRGPARWTGGPVAGLWGGVRRSSAMKYDPNDNAFEYNLSGSQAVSWLTFLSDGTMIEGLPPAGLWALDPAAAERQASGGAAAWGTWRVEGDRVTATCRKGRKLAWTLKDGLLVEDPRFTGYTQFRRLPSVDGLVLDGTWSTSQRWEESSGVQGWTGRPLIRFTRDGRFEDRGAFMSDYLVPQERHPPAERPGRGRYVIQGFTLMLRFDDGREVQHTLTPPLTGDLLKDPARLFLGNRAYFRQ